MASFSVLFEGNEHLGVREVYGGGLTEAVKISQTKTIRVNPSEIKKQKKAVEQKCPWTVL